MSRKKTQKAPYTDLPEVVAIMKNVHCGVGDRGEAWLSFDSYISEHVAALQIIPWEEAKEFIEAYGVSDVYKLEGKPVWVRSGNNVSLYSRPWKG